MRRCLSAAIAALFLLASCSGSDPELIGEPDPTAGDATPDGTVPLVSGDQPTPIPEQDFDPETLPEGVDEAAVVGYMRQFGIDQETATCVADELRLDGESVDREKLSDLKAEICGMTVGQLLGVFPRDE
jgi:hypothetical protein